MDRRPANGDKLDGLMDAISQKPRPLAGRSAWIFTTGAAGMDTQTRGVADALGVDYAMKPMSPRGLARWLAPWGPVSGAEHFGQPGSTFAPPWPEVAIGLGRASVPYVRALRRRSPETFTLLMLDTRAGRRAANVIWAPEHDRLRGENVITTLTAPHSFSAERLAMLRRKVPPAIAALPGPRLAVILGGRNAVYDFTARDIARFRRSAGVTRGAGGELHDHAVAAHARLAARGGG
ncbi:MAG: ELM1/GtrOC1 family putative glycosyltransferase [Hyphomicrobium sp.]